MLGADAAAQLVDKIMDNAVDGDSVLNDKIAGPGVCRRRGVVMQMAIANTSYGVKHLTTHHF